MSAVICKPPAVNKHIHTLNPLNCLKKTKKKQHFLCAYLSIKLVKSRDGNMEPLICQPSVCPAQGKQRVYYELFGFKCKTYLKHKMLMLLN